MTFSYSPEIYNERSAQIVLPLIFQIIRPSSILDIGCGNGDWLKVAKDLGVNCVKGVDGDHILRSNLKISPDDFFCCDLEKPLPSLGSFDLVMCLEVIEHLSLDAGINLINGLTEYSDIILFSAAIPGQGGVQHINEQWPTFWQNHFFNKGFIMVDCVRSLIWHNTEVQFWYRQNIFLVIKQGHILLDKISSSAPIFSCVHPELFELILKNNSDKIKKLKGEQNIKAMLLKRLLRFF